MVVALLLLSCYIAPVAAPVSVPFDAPPCSWCAGHRGLEYAVEPGTPVVAAADGVVTFAGVVVGTRYVVVRNDDGLVATYGVVESSQVKVGAVVHAGEPVATASSTLYFGLRRDGIYIDPAPFMGAIARQARLVPTNGSPGRPARPRSPTCAATAAGGATDRSRR